LFFDGWADLGRIAVIGTLAYFGLVALIRVTGKRTLSKMNAFDLIVTVALGSTLATVLLSKDVALLEGLLALALLCGLQYLVAFLSVRSERFRAVIKSEPRLLFADGDFLQAALRDERVTEGEVLAAGRSQGFPTLANVRYVILETDGSLSVVTASDGEGALPGVRVDRPDEAP
jgi:uncharacterized membrane protein YcaP (DUF421 family)